MTNKDTLLTKLVNKAMTPHDKERHFDYDIKTNDI